MLQNLVDVKPIEVRMSIEALDGSTVDLKEPPALSLRPQILVIVLLMVTVVMSILAEQAVGGLMTLLQCWKSAM